MVDLPTPTVPVINSADTTIADCQQSALGRGIVGRAAIVFVAVVTIAVAGPVVEPAGRPSVVLDGGPVLGPWDHVVDLAVLGGEIAARVVALAVPELDGPLGGAGEDPPLDADVDDP